MPLQPSEQPLGTRSISAEPSLLDEHYASYFALSKEQLLERTDDDRVHQTGGAYIPARIEIPDLDVVYAGLSEPLIETFLVDPSGACAPTGNDADLIALMAPLASQMATSTIDALTGAGVALATPGYLTASVSPLDMVANEPHLDDDQFVPADGIGAVAIIADSGGTRLAIDPIPHRLTRPNLPLQMDDGALTAFDDATLRIQHAVPGKIVVFPQFGQLHAGPTQAELGDKRRVRTLLVFRMTTVPEQP